MPRRAQPWDRRPPVARPVRPATRVSTPLRALIPELLASVERSQPAVRIERIEPFTYSWNTNTITITSGSISTTGSQFYWGEVGVYSPLKEPPVSTTPVDPRVMDIVISVEDVTPDAIYERMDTADKFLRWFWHFGHAEVADPLHLPSRSVVKTSKVLWALFSRMREQNYWPPEDPHARALLNQSSYADATIMLFLLEEGNPLFAYARNYLRGLTSWFRLLGYGSISPRFGNITEALGYLTGAHTALPRLMADHNLYICHEKGLHLSPDPMLVRFYPTTDKLIRDLPVSTTIGKALGQVFGPLSRWDALATAQRDRFVRMASEAHRDYYGPDGLEYLTDPEAIVEAYRHCATGSCMSKDAASFSSHVHPISVYGDTPGLALAVLRRGELVRGRCLVYTDPDNPEDKRWIRVYGEEVLKLKLERAGFKHGSLAGAKLRKVPAQFLNGEEIPNTFVMPYLDDLISGGRGAYVFSRRGLDYFLVTDNTSEGRVACPGEGQAIHLVGRSTNGLIGTHATYTRELDRKIWCLVHDIRYFEPNNREINQDGLIRCTPCLQVFAPVDRQVNTVGLFASGMFYCHPCATRELVRGRQYAGASYTDDVLLHRRSVYQHIEHPEFFVSAFEFPEHLFVRFFGSYYPTNTNAGLFIEKERARNCGTPRNPVWIDAKDAILCINGKYAHRSQTRVFAIVDSTPSYIQRQRVLSDMLQRGRLFVRNRKLEYVARPKPVTPHSVPSLMGYTHEENEEEVFTSTSQRIPLLDVLTLLLSHVTTRNLGEEKLLATRPSAIINRVQHQLARILPFTPEDITHELVSEWFETTFQLYTAQSPAVLQRVAHVNSVFKTQVPRVSHIAAAAAA